MRLSDYENPRSYLQQEHGAENAEEAGRRLCDLLNEQERIRVQIADLVKAINAAWPEPLARLRAEHPTV